MPTTLHMSILKGALECEEERSLYEAIAWTSCRAPGPRTGTQHRVGKAQGMLSKASQAWAVGRDLERDRAVPQRCSNCFPGAVTARVGAAGCIRVTEGLRDWEASNLNFNNLPL